MPATGGSLAEEETDPVASSQAGSDSAALRAAKPLQSLQKSSLDA